MKLPATYSGMRMLLVAPPGVTLSGPGISAAGQELMSIWNQMDRGAMKEGEGFEEADRAVRRRQASAEREV